MPALQSPWFAPHVIVYMFAYAMLGAATVMAVYLLWFKKKKIERKEMDLCDNPHLCRSGIYDIRYAYRSYLGERSLGTLLGLGPERNMGGSDLVCLSGIYSFQIGKTIKGTSGIGYFIGLFCLITNVLVWNQLSSVRTRSQCTYV